MVAPVPDAGPPRPGASLIQDGKAEGMVAMLFNVIAPVTIS